MNFTSTNAIAETLAAHLNSLTDEQAQPLLKTVKVILGSNSYAKLFKTLPELTDFPAAVVTLGSVNYEHGGVTRRVECNVTLIERPYGIVEQEAAAQNHLEKLLVALTGNTAGQVLRLEGIPFVMGETKQLEYEPEYQVWNVAMGAMQ